MKKDLICKTRWQRVDEITVRCPNTNETVFVYTANILDENGELLSWYAHDVFKKLSYLYYDVEKKRFWLPKNKLYSKTKCKALYKRKDYSGRKVVNHFAFFNKAYLEDLIGVSRTTKPGITGLFAPGAGLI